jgi:hypothetical protein
MARLCQAGNIFLPHPSLANWIDEWLEEYAVFDHGTHDDQVDSGTQAINFLSATRRVWADYHGEISTFQIKWSELLRSSQLLISQWVDRDLSSGVLLALWSGRDHKLWIFDEFTADTSRPELVISALMALTDRDSGGVIKDVRGFQWWGNNLMFGTTTQRSSISPGSAHEYYNKQKIFPRRSERYDEFGAIVQTARMMIKKQIVIHSRCKELKEQAVSWSIDNKAPASGYALCRALCLMVSSLYESGAMEKAEKKITEYSREHTDFINRADRAAKQGKLDEFVATQGRMKGTKKKGWWV